MPLAQNARAELLAQVLTPAAHAALPPWERRDAAANLLTAVLDGIEQSGQPDAWESHHLCHAIGFMLARMHTASYAAVENALAAPHERVDPPGGNEATIAALRDALAYARGAPA